MSRSEARECAFKFLYELAVQKEDREIQEKLFLEDHAMNDSELLFFRRLVDGVTAEADALDAVIAPLLKGWRIERLPLIDLSILRLALYEILYCEDVPDSVSISEAVLLAKKYSSEEARSYINAVLAALQRQKGADKTPCPEN